MQRFSVFWGASWFTIIKGWHFTEFAILLVLSVEAVRWWKDAVTSRSIVGAMLFCIAFAITDEWHQSFVPDRFGTAQDVLIDSFGVCAAGIVLLLRQRRKNAPIQTMNPSDGSGGF